MCDIAAGMTAYQAMLQALIGRGRTGEGRAIDVSLYHAVADWMNVPYLQYAYGGQKPARAGLKHPTIAPYGAFSCADGKALLISIQNDREWRDLCVVIGEPALADDPRFATNLARVSNRAETDALVATNISRRVPAMRISRPCRARASPMDGCRISTTSWPIRRTASSTSQRHRVGAASAPAADCARRALSLGPVPA